jgi:protein TonB
MEPFHLLIEPDQELREEEVDAPGADARPTSFRNPESDRPDRYLKYCVLASLLLHVAILAALPRLAAIASRPSFLKPGETVTPIRLVEFPTPEKTPEQPPEKASAISDRNHTAERERLPKNIPGSKPLLGRIAPPPERMASLSPPQVPEELMNSMEEKAEEDPKALRSNGKHPTRKRLPDEKKPSEATLEKKATGRQHGVDLRPTPNEIARALAGPGGSSDFFPDGDREEAVVDINTREDRFFSYLLHLKKKIEGVWVYPRAAATSGIGGELILEFLVSQEGQLLGVTLLDSSGVPVLDQSAVTAIRTAAPYHPFPPWLKAKRLRIRARFIYITQSYFRRIM